MTDAECDLLIEISNKPGRRMMLRDIKAKDRKTAEALRSNGFLVAFVGEWVAVTDAGYDASILHCAHNF